MSTSPALPRFDRLFHVLVVLGAASCGEDDGTSQRDLQIDAATGDVDAPVSTGEDAATSTGDGGTELLPCFCNRDACCDRSGETAIVTPGFECCWSTTCP